LAGVGWGVADTDVDVEADIGLDPDIALGGVDRRLPMAARSEADDDVGKCGTGRGGGGSDDMCDCVLE
jgi:hypothetical protein